MSETQVYAVLCAPCLPIDYEDDSERVNKRVVMRFDSEEQMNNEADNFFDNVYGSYQRGLDRFEKDLWQVDESPEIERTISKEEAEKIGYVIFVSD